MENLRTLKNGGDPNQLFKGYKESRSSGKSHKEALFECIYKRYKFGRDELGLLLADEQLDVNDVLEASMARHQEITKPYTRAGRSTVALISQLTKERANPPVTKLHRLMAMANRSKSVCQKEVETPRSITATMLSRDESNRTYDALVAKINQHVPIKRPDYGGTLDPKFIRALMTSRIGEPGSIQC